MEILDLKFAGVPLHTWFMVFGVCWFVHRIYVATRIEILDWQQRRAEKREYEAKTGRARAFAPQDR
jgi:hypothetical protein